MSKQTLVETLALERLEQDLFRGFTPDTPPNADNRIYGGQVAAQALWAAYYTIEERLCHSLHCYFIRPGDPSIPIIFEVDRARDGGSFATRRVVAIQHGQQILNLAASFQKPEEGFEHQRPMPEVVHWRDRRTEAELEQIDTARTRRWLAMARPIEMRDPDPFDFFSTDGREPERRPPFHSMWFRARDPIPDDPRLHQVALAYASDMTLLATAMRPHPVGVDFDKMVSASLDHAIWFHRPVNFSGWHLYDQESPSASGGRGLARASIYSEDGALVASVAQEGLMRARRPRP